MLDVTGVLKSELLAGDLVHDSLAVVISQTPTKLVVVHARLVLAGTPQLGDVLGGEDAELITVACPLDHVLLVWGEEKIQEELPELNRSTTCWDCEN